MRFVSCFSGIEAASVAWAPLGWTCAGVAEVEPFPCAVLAHRYPDVPNLGDVTADDFLQRVSALRPDVLVGGPPCQDFSVAGLRAGLGGDRGNLSLRWVEIIRAIRPAFAVTENVPGWLSVNRGHAFGAFLAGLVGHDTALVPPRNCGGRWTNAGMVAGPLGRVAWRVLDAQYFGLAQRRQRVFAVFCPRRDGADPAAVLFESKSLQGHSPPRREAGEGTAGGAEQRAAISSGRGWWDDSDVGATIRAQDSVTKADTLIATALRARDGAKGVDSDCTDTLVAIPLQEISDGRDKDQNGLGIGQGGDPMFTLQAGAQHGVAVACGVTIHGTDKTARVASMTDLAGVLRARAPGGRENSTTTAVLAVALDIQSAAAVRRLTPVECARLQGFPDTYLDIPFRGRPAADGNKYRALGNSMAVPCIAWLGRRIQKEDASILSVERVAA